jgi:hypothetical protein
MVAKHYIRALLGLFIASGCGGSADTYEDESDTSAPVYEEAPPTYAEKCQALKDTAKACFNSACVEDGSTGFCGCWTQGMDLNTNTCECVPLDLDAACAQVDLDTFDPASFRCDLAKDAVQSYCNL